MDTSTFDSIIDHQTKMVDHIQVLEEELKTGPRVQRLNLSESENEELEERPP